MPFSPFRASRRLEATPLRIDKVLFVGQCLLQPWIAPIERTFAPDTRVDFVLFNHFMELQDDPPSRPADYAFQVVSPPLRIVLPETVYPNLAYSDSAAAEALFQGVCQRLDMVLDAAMKWNVRHGIQTFVTNFFVPQQNPDGRLLPRYDLRNMVFFIEKLNEHLAARIETYRGAAILDIDAISASIGRRYVQDDAVWIFAHGSMLYDHDIHYDIRRIERPPQPATAEFEIGTEAFVGEVWGELVAMFRTLRRADSVKMVIVDLDDTLWRGVLAEEEAIQKYDAEGWPLGLVEALLYLKRRGVILAIASKNEESVVARILEALYAPRLRLSDFALKRIDWRPKPETIAEMLEEANLLPENVVFIDDNPVEREAVARAFPAMRVLGDRLYAIRRDLLWSAETQVPTITRESERRGGMVRAQVDRERARRVMSREDFLASLDVSMTIFEVRDRDPNFARAIELLNKTNQFNTTGRRWREDEMAGLLNAGMRMIGFTVADSFTDYGLVGIVLVESAGIVQFVMSCRVIGLGVEEAAVRIIADHLREVGAARITAALIETATNFPCRELYAKCGFERDDTGWTAAAASVVDCPAHVATHVCLGMTGSVPPADDQGAKISVGQVR